MYNRLCEIQDILDSQRDYYTEEQWNLLRRLGNYETGLASFMKLRSLGHYKPDEEVKCLRQQVQEKESIQKKWEHLFKEGTH